MALTVINMNPIELFAAQYMSHYLTHPVAKFHRTIYAELYDESNDLLSLECMRGSGKTTIASITYALYLLCEGKDAEFQVISRSGGTTGTATKIMAKVKRELETNQLLLHDYGIKRGESWGQDHIQVIRGDGKVVDFYSLGKRSSIRGSRGTVIIDDPQNYDDCVSETVLTRDEEWLLTDILPVMLPGQRLMFIYTPIHPLALGCKLKKMEDFKSLSFPAEDPVWSGKSVWQEHYPDEFLAKRFRMMGKIRYGSEYLCIARVSDNPTFQEEWIQGYEPDTALFREVENIGLYRVTGMDGAESKADSADYTAIITVGATSGENPDVYLLDVKREKWSVKDGASFLLNTFTEFKQHKTIVESRVKDNKTKTGGDALIVQIRDQERIYKNYVNLYPVRPVSDKVTRALYIQPLIQEGRFFVNFKDPAHVGLVNEMVMFDGKGTFHDDRVDALVYAITDVIDRGKGFVNEEVKSAIGDSW